MRAVPLLAPLLVAILAGPLVAVAQAPAAGADEAPWWTRTRLDADRDGVDDALAPFLQDDAPLTVIVSYAHAPRADEARALRDAGADVTFAPAHFPILIARTAGARVADLARLPGVLLVEANDVIVPLLAESVPLIGVPQAWTRYGATGKGIVVAVLDDGAYEQHPDLQPKLAASYNAAAASGGLAPTPAEDAVVPAGENGHATHVAGTIVGRGGESGGRYKGVAPDARFVNVQVFTAPNRTSSDVVLRGLDWVLSHKDSLGIRIAQMSLGGRASDGTDALSRAVDIATDEGLVVIAAAGNAGPGAGTITSPGAAEKAVTVGAVDKRKAVASFSSRGPTLDGRVKPDLVAPGRSITSTVPPSSTTGIGGVVGGGDTLYYGSLSGTSMAAPHVAGTAALMLEANPSLTPRDVKRILLATAQDLGAPGKDHDTGFGFLNGIAAVQVADNPALLQSAHFRDVLATIPDPPPETLLDRLAYDASRLQRDGAVGPVLGLAVLLLAIVGVGASVVASRRRRGQLPPPGPPEQ